MPLFLAVMFFAFTADTASAAPTFDYFNRNTTVLQSGDTFYLRWSTQNANSCTAEWGGGTAGWSGSKPVSSGWTSFRAPTVTSDTSRTYRLSCSGFGGTVARNITISIIAPKPPPTNRIE